jgi:UDP-glucose 4-epimerase
MSEESLVRAYRGRSVLVTGGAGFIGSHLVDALLGLGANVSVVDNLTTKSWLNLSAQERRYIRFGGDVRSRDDVDRFIVEAEPSIIFHLAANASVPISVEDPSLDFTSNALGTFNVLDSVRRLSPKTRVIFASSAAVYGEPGRERITEATALAPISPYGASKLCGEVECRLYAQIFSIDAVIGRIFNSYGPRMPRFVVLDFLRKLDRRTDVLEILGSGGQTRDFTYVGDTVAGLLVLGERGKRGEAYNIASGVSHSVTELAHHLLEIVGLKAKTALAFTGGSWAGDAQYWAVNISKLQELGFSPRYSLGQGLTHVVEWYRDREQTK